MLQISFAIIEAHELTIFIELQIYVNCSCFSVKKLKFSWPLKGPHFCRQWVVFIDPCKFLLFEKHQKFGRSDSLPEGLVLFLLPILLGKFALD